MLQNSQKIDYELSVEYRQKFKIISTMCIFDAFSKVMNNLRNIGLLRTTILDIIENLQTNRLGLSTICDIKL